MYSAEDTDLTEPIIYYQDNYHNNPILTIINLYVTFYLAPHDINTAHFLFI